MDLETAKKITGECVDNKMFSMGIGDKLPPSLEDYTLLELLEANHMVRADNGTKTEDGKTSHALFCDDRLVAALYTFYHYEDEPPTGDIEPIVHIFNKALVCIRVDTED